MDIVASSRESRDKNLDKSRLVLIVDDDESILRTTRLLLENLGYFVLEADNGPDCLEIFQEKFAEIRCVILDLAMPGLSGVDVLRQLIQAKKDLPVVVTSGMDTHKILSEWGHTANIVFLQKPFRLAELMKSMRMAIGH